MHSVTDERARQRMVSSFDLETTVGGGPRATGIALCGPEATLFGSVPSNDVEAE